MRRFVVVVTVVVMACQPASVAPLPSASETDGAPVRGGRLIEGSFTDAKTFAPFLANDAASLTVSGLLYDTLFRVDARTGEIKPNLASWTVSADGLTYRWRIEPGAVWSDGKPIVAGDYVTGVKAVARSKKTVRAASFQDIVGFDEYRAGKSTTISGITIDPLDAKSFSVKFKRVFCPALTNAFGAAAGPLPAHVYGKYLEDVDARVDDAPENMAPTVTSGPFVFHQWKPGDEIALDRNESYFRGAPYLDGYVLKIVADVTTLATQLKRGEINFGTIEPKDLADVRKRDTLRVYSYQDLSYDYIGWNLKSASVPALADKRVRQALAYGLDMDAVVQQMLSGQGVRVYQHHLASSWAAADPVTLARYPYDRAKAEDLLKRAGFARGADGVYQKDGKPLEIAVMTNSGNKLRETLLQTVIDQYGQIGVRVTPRLVPFDTMVDMLSSRSEDVPAWIIGWRLNVEPDPFGIWHSSAIPDPAKRTTGYNFGSFSSPDADRLIEAARTPADGDCAEATRKKSYDALNRLLNDAQPYDFGFSPTTLLVATRALRGLDPGTFSTYGDIERWWLAR
ncbi:MAG TPA: ABC transporter substrate-binding protein [Candidatus Limnocylindria bacterium]|nr:ABC transporter substrate-binding protein [Candidatus Limnocylindria bacterium]